MRLDQYLVENGFVESRNIAQTAIKNKEVLVDDKIILKPSFKINEQKVVLNLSKNYVSRAGYKLDGFLQNDCDLDISSLTALDIGASTGGFTQVLLDREIKSVTSLDVGSKQLHHSLLKNNKVTSIEQQDIRTFKTEQKFDLITCDVSFISILNIINNIDQLAKSDIIILLKPQFEVGKNAKRDAKGVVQDKKLIDRSITKFETTAFALGWKLISTAPSIILGKEGNIEYLYHFKKH
jgi:23S rRNA (cytidine1920-2'-O)/16S rRNA (cytidine1409-2'-O)-methyltransferase